MLRKLTFAMYPVKDLPKARAFHAEERGGVGHA